MQANPAGTPDQPLGTLENWDHTCALDFSEPPNAGAMEVPRSCPGTSRGSVGLARSTAHGPLPWVVLPDPTTLVPDGRPVKSVVFPSRHPDGPAAKGPRHFRLGESPMRRCAPNSRSHCTLLRHWCDRPVASVTYRAPRVSGNTNTRTRRIRQHRHWARWLAKGGRGPWGWLRSPSNRAPSGSHGRPAGSGRGGVSSNVTVPAVVRMAILPLPQTDVISSQSWSIVGGCGRGVPLMAIPIFAKSTVTRAPPMVTASTRSPLVVRPCTSVPRRRTSAQFLAQRRLPAPFPRRQIQAWHQPTEQDDRRQA